MDQFHGVRSRATSYPGGISLNAIWNPGESTLIYQLADIPGPFIDLNATVPDSAVYKPIDGRTKLHLNAIRELITQLPDQKALAHDGIAAFDGIGYEFGVLIDGHWVSVSYNNPEAHPRIMDAACIGIIARLTSIVSGLNLGLTGH